MPSTDYTEADRALTALWAAVRGHHAALPELRASIGPRRGRGAPAWGHRVHPAPAGGLELVIEPDLWEQGSEAVLVAVLDDAAHALAEAAGEQSLSQQGRYHPARFAAHAAEVGLTLGPARGAGPDGLTPAARERYSAHLDRLDALHQTLPPPAAAPAPSSAWIPAACACRPPRRLRCSPSLLDNAAPMCPICNRPYRPAKEHP